MCFSFLLPTWVEFPVAPPPLSFFLAEKDHFGPWPSLPVPGSAAWWREGNPGVMICSGLRGTSIYLLSLDARITRRMPHDSWHTYITIYIRLLDRTIDIVSILRYAVCWTIHIDHRSALPENELLYSTTLYTIKARNVSKWTSPIDAQIRYL